MENEIKLKTKNIVLTVLLGLLVLVIGIMAFYEKDPLTKIITLDPIVVPAKPAEIKEVPGKSIYDTIFLPQDTLIIEGEYNKKLLLDVLKYRDSIKLLHAYIDAIKIREYTGTINDQYATINYRAKTTGTLDSIQIGYTIKERDVPIEIKTKPKFLVGAGIYSPTNEIKPHATLGAAYQTRKGDLFSLDYSTSKQVYFSYKTNLFK